MNSSLILKCLFWFCVGGLIALLYWSLQQDAKQSYESRHITQCVDGYLYEGQANQYYLVLTDRKCIVRKTK